MAQSPIEQANGPGITVRTGFNSANVALVTDFSGPAAPSPTYPFMKWNDTTNNLRKQRDGANTLWRTIGTLALPKIGDITSSTVLDQSAWGRTFLVDASGGNITVTLPLVADNVDMTVDFIRVDGSANSVTLTPTSPDDIAGAANLGLPSEGDVASLAARPSQHWASLISTGVATIGDLSNVDTTSTAPIEGSFLKFTTGSNLWVTDNDDLIFEEETGTTYQAVLADRRKVKVLTNAAAITMTLPEDTTLNLPVGFQIIVQQGGAGQVTFVVEGSDLLQSRGNLFTTLGQYAMIGVVKRASGVWTIMGDLQ